MKLKLITGLLLLMVFAYSASAQQSVRKASNTVTYEQNDGETSSSFEEKCCAKGGYAGKHMQPDKDKASCGNAGSGKCSGKCTAGDDKAAAPASKEEKGRGLKKAGRTKSCCSG